MIFSCIAIGYKSIFKDRQVQLLSELKYYSIGCQMAILGTLAILFISHLAIGSNNYTHLGMPKATSSTIEQHQQ